MRTTRTAAALLVLAALALTGCSSDDEPDPSPSSSEPTGEPTTEPTSDPTETETGAPAGPQVFESTITPADGVAEGDTVTATATDALPGTAYFCVLSVITADGTLTASNTASAQVVTAGEDGALECEQTFAPFEAADENGDTRACPPTDADVEAGFSCAIAIADQTTVGATSASVGFFTTA